MKWRGKMNLLPQTPFTVRWEGRGLCDFPPTYTLLPIPTELPGYATNQSINQSIQSHCPFNSWINNCRYQSSISYYASCDTNKSQIIKISSTEDWKWHLLLCYYSLIGNLICTADSTVEPTVKSCMYVFIYLFILSTCTFLKYEQCLYSRQLIKTKMKNHFFL